MHQHPWLRGVVFLGLVVTGCGDCGRNTGTNTSSSSSTGGGDEEPGCNCLAAVHQPAYGAMVLLMVLGLVRRRRHG